MHKLAIVIPYYKIDYFEETLKSIAGQTDKDFVLYIGNDKSVNDPLPLIEKYLLEDQYQYFDYQENYGGKNLLLQWERILENVNEEWFQILGDDDFISQDFVEEFSKHYKNITSEINVVKVKNITCDAEGSRLTNESYFENLASGTYNMLNVLLHKFRGHTNSSLSEHIFRTKKYREIGFKHYPLAWHSDDMFLLQMSNLKNFYFINSTCVYIRIFSESITGGSRYSDLKRKASELFFMDFSTYMNRENIPWYYRKIFLKSLRKEKENIGMENLKYIYYENGFRGRLYYMIYQLKLFCKCLLPKRVISKIQGEKI
ncbi:TPA: glycosyltransferase [Elizabethkingia anophelis]